MASRLGRGRSVAQVEAQIEYGGAVREGTDGQVVDTGRGHLGGPVEGEPAAGFQARPGAPGQADRGDRVVERKVVQQDQFDAGRERLADLVERVALDLQRDGGRVRAHGLD